MSPRGTCDLRISHLCAPVDGIEPTVEGRAAVRECNRN